MKKDAARTKASPCTHHRTVLSKENDSRQSSSKDPTDKAISPSFLRTPPSWQDQPKRFESAGTAFRWLIKQLQYPVICEASSRASIIPCGGFLALFMKNLLKLSGDKWILETVMGSFPGRLSKIALDVSKARIMSAEVLGRSELVVYGIFNILSLIHSRILHNILYPVHILWTHFSSLTLFGDQVFLCVQFSHDEFMLVFSSESHITCGLTSFFLNTVCFSWSSLTVSQLQSLLSLLLYSTSALRQCCCRGNIKVGIVQKTAKF